MVVDFCGHDSLCFWKSKGNFVSVMSKNRESADLGGRGCRTNGVLSIFIQRRVDQARLRFPVADLGRWTFSISDRLAFGDADSTEID